MRTKKSHFDRVVAKFYPSVFRLAIRFSSSHQHAALVARATFERAARHASHFRTSESLQFLLLTALSEELSAGQVL